MKRYYNAIRSKKFRDNLTYEEVIKLYENNQCRQKVELNGKMVTIKEYCILKNISYAAVLHKKQRTNLNYKEILAYYENKPKIIKYKGKVKSVRLRKIWSSMLTRCYNKNCANYKNYGGRGISVCDNWLNYINFESDMYESYLKHVENYGEKETTLDRINVNDNYCLENCRWATNKEQARNRRNTIYVPSGESLKEYCENNNLNYNTISSRIQKGQPIEDAINMPIRK